MTYPYTFGVSSTRGPLFFPQVQANFDYLLASPSFTGPTMLLENSLDGRVIFEAKNDTNGTQALAEFVATNYTGAQFQLGKSGGLVYGALGATDGFLYDPSAICIMADNANSVIKFAAGGNTEIARVDSMGLTSKSDTLSPTTYANRPGTPTQGMLAAFTDSNTVTWGAVIAGLGAGKVIGHYNGTNWTVAAV